MAVYWCQPYIHHICVTPIRMFLRPHPCPYQCTSAAHMSKCLHDIRICLITGAILDAVFCAVVSVPIWQFIKEHIRAFIKKPRPKSLIPEKPQPQRNIAGRYCNSACSAFFIISDGERYLRPAQQMFAPLNFPLFLKMETYRAVRRINPVRLHHDQHTEIYLLHPRCRPAESRKWNAGAA